MSITIVEEETKKTFLSPKPKGTVVDHMGQKNIHAMCHEFRKEFAQILI